MSNEKMRESFEEWYSLIFHGGEKANMPIRSDGEYRSVQTQIAWMAWQAAAAATRHDAMAVAEAVRDEVASVVERWGDGPYMPKFDLAAIVEAAQPTSTQQQGEPVAWIERRFLNGELIMSVVKDQKMPELERARLAEHYDLETVPLYTAPAAPACRVPAKPPTRVFVLPMNVAELIDSVFLPLNPNKLRAACQDVKDAVKIYKESLQAAQNRIAAAPKAGGVVQVCKLGIYGKAYDSPQEKRAYTYTDQPDNTAAWKLGKAIAKASAGGDSIDHGLSLLRELQAEGFGVFELAAAPKMEGGDA